MTFLPIVSRELRIASRRRGTYWLRSGAALGISIAGAWLFLILRGESPRHLAAALFGLLTGATTLLALMSGPRSTADAISEEKREGTLGLLFLTDLKGYDVVLGKLAAGSLTAFYAVVSVLPMMAIPLLLGGGITFAEFGRMSLVTVSALFFSLAVSICVSSLCRSAQKAAAVSSLLIVLITAGLPACGAAWMAAKSSTRPPMTVLAPSIGFSYYAAFDNVYRNDKFWFWVSLGFVHAMAWLSLVIASIVTPASWKDRSQGPAGQGWRGFVSNWSYGSRVPRERLRRRLLDINPLYWLGARMCSKVYTVWVFLGLFAAVWLLGWWKFKKEWLNEGNYVITALLLNLAIRYWLAGEATRALADQRKTGALELLMSTPIHVLDVLRGFSLAVKRQFLFPVLLVLFVECGFMFAGASNAVPDEERGFWVTMWLAGMLMFVADLVALFWISLWAGLTARNPLRALATSLVVVLVLPWVAYAGVLGFMVLTQLGPGVYHPNPTWQFFLALWFGFGLGTDLLFGVLAWQRLNRNFRWVLQEAFTTRRSGWTRWLRPLPGQATRPEAAPGGVT